MAKSKKIVMTGGGTAGHVTPNIALMPALQEAGYEITYIGSYNGMEKELIEAQKIPYIGISSGKLRRYFDWKNFSDPFKVLKGYGQAISILRKLKPDVVFSKGGFVSVPVVLAAKHCHIPAIIHESDITPGLANKIAIRGAKKVCCNFPETMKYLPAEKAVLTGSPIRRELFHGDAEKSLHYCGFPDHNKPVLLIVGGSSGSKVINEANITDIFCVSKHLQVSLFQPRHLIADFLDLLKTMGYKKDRCPMIPHVLDPRLTFFLKMKISYRKDFINDQDVRRTDRCDRKRKSGNHSRRKILDRNIHKLRQF